MGKHPFIDDSSKQVFYLIDAASKGQCERRQTEVIDRSLGVLIFLTDQSPSWYVQFKDEQGIPRRKSLRTGDIDEARRKAWEFTIRESDGVIAPARRRPPTLREAVDRFLERGRRAKLRKGSLANYRGQLNQFVQFMEERRVTRLDRVTPDHVEAFEARLAKTGILAPNPRQRGRKPKPNKASVIHDKAKIVMTLYRWAVRKGLLTEDPLLGYELPADGESDRHCFTAQEVELICKTADGFFGRVFRFLAVTGLRVGEMVRLEKQDVDLGRRRMHVREKVDWKPKSRHGVRTVPLCPTAVDIVRSMIEEFPESRYLFPAPQVPGVRDDRLRETRLCAQLRRTRIKAGVQAGVVHSFRHFFVSAAANRNVSPFKLMKIVGHGDLDIILRYYHVDDGELVEAIDEIGFENLFKKP